MIAKYWKKLGLIVLVIACLFNIVSKIVKRTPLKEQLIQTKQQNCTICIKSRKINKNT